jgi:stage V sporulation protein AA
MDIYIKANERVEIIGKATIKIKDVCEVLAETAVKQKIEEAIILNIKDKKDHLMMISIIDIIKIINNLYPNASINNLNVSDILVDYKHAYPKEHKILECFKILFVSSIIFFGSAVAIMSFNNDAQMGRIFDVFSKILFEEEEANTLLISLSYSIGLFVGIVTFFNHFGGVKITDDPTPIEVEMLLYEKNVNDIIVYAMNNERMSEKMEVSGSGSNS